MLGYHLRVSLESLWSKLFVNKLKLNTNAMMIEIVGFDYVRFSFKPQKIVFLFEMNLLIGAALQNGHRAKQR